MNIEMFTPKTPSEVFLLNHIRKLERQIMEVGERPIERPMFEKKGVWQDMPQYNHLPLAIKIIGHLKGDTIGIRSFVYSGDDEVSVGYYMPSDELFRSKVDILGEVHKAFVSQLAEQLEKKVSL